MLFLVPFYAALSSLVLTIILYLGMNRKLFCLKCLATVRAHVTYGLDFLLLSVFFWLAELIFSIQPIKD